MAMTFETQKELEIILRKISQDNILPVADPAKMAAAIWQQKEKIEIIRKTISAVSHTDLKFLRQFQAAQVKKMPRGKKRMSKKRQMVQIRFFGEIDKLRADGYSYAEIEKYIAKFHKAKISAVSIWRYYTLQKKAIEEAKSDY